MNSKNILTVAIAYLQMFLNEFWSIACPRAQLQHYTEHAIFDRKWAWS